MAVGNPISLTDNVASRIISQIATESQTDFTISGGYRLNAISVYRNGVRLVSGRDYSAADGSTVVLLSGASLSDVLEFHIFDDFRVADAIVSNASHQNIEGNLTIAGILTVTSLDLTSLTVSDSISIGGTLTYEDVTNVDSIGIITARTDIHVGAGLSVVGVSTFTGNAIFSGDVDLGSGTSDTITIAGKLDSDLIPSTSDQKDLGSSSLKWKDLYVDGTGNIDTLVSGDGTFSTNLGIGTANPTNYGGAVKLALSSSGHTGLSIAAGTSSDSNIFFADGTAGDATYRGNIKYAHDGDSMRFFTAATEKLRITSGGLVGIGTTNPSAKLDVRGNLNLNSDGTAGFISIIGARTNNGNNAFFEGKSSRGTIASPATLVANDIIATFNGLAHDGSNYLSAGRVRFGVESISTGDLDSNLQLWVCNNGEYEALRITSGGSVGIGTDNPIQKLDVIGGNIRVGKTSNGKYIAENSSGQSKVVIDSSGTSYLNGGSVGIGTESPHAKLEVSGGQNQTANQFTDLVSIAANANNDGIAAEVQLNFGISPSHTAEANRKARIQSVTHGGTVTPLLINPAGGNIGIGTDNPTGKLQIGSATGSHVIITENTGVDINDGAINLYQATTNVNAAPFIISTDVGGTETEKLRVTGAGKVGIGTDNPSGTLTLFGASSSSFRISKSGVLAYDHTFNGTSYTIANNNGNAGIPIIIGTKISGGESLRITSGGSVGIGTNNPSVKLHVHDGSVRTTNTAKNNFTELGTDGNIEIKRNGGGAYIDFADGVSEDYDVRVQEVSNGLKIVTGGQDSASERVRITSTGNIGIGSASPVTDVDISQKTGAVALPQGTTAQRPSGSSPYIRYNTTNSALEFYNGTNWVEIITDYFPTGSTIFG